MIACSKRKIDAIPVFLSLRDGECGGCGTRAPGKRRSNGGLGASEPSAP